MKRNRIPSFRGLHALIEHAAGADRTVLRNQLEQLGLRVTTADERPMPLPADADVFFFDADSLASRPDEDDDRQPYAIPSIALIGFEAPSRLEALLSRQPSAYLTKPIRRTGVYSCLAIAMHQFAALRETHLRLRAAEERVRLRRKVVSAVIHLMRQGQLSEGEAYRLLQRGAMARRISIEDLSLQVMSKRRSIAELLADEAGDRRHVLG